MSHQETKIITENLLYSLVTGGQVSRVDPDCTGLNPAWRSSLAYIGIGTSWQDGANEIEINAARQALIQDMKVVEGIAPDSGAYLNEVNNHWHVVAPTQAFILV